MAPITAEDLFVSKWCNANLSVGEYIFKISQISNPIHQKLTSGI